MFSSVGDQAVGAIGTANTYIGMFIIMFSIISSGMIAVMTQYIGAGAFTGYRRLSGEADWPGV